MIASSSRLVLWAPSSAFLKEYSFLEPREFLDYVDEGLVQVTAREPWLLNRERRNRIAEDRFPGAAWDDLVDNTLRGWCKADDNNHVPDLERRVRAAPPEGGLAWADAYLEEHPELLDTLGSFADDQVKANAEIPSGTLEAARTQAQVGDRRTFAQWILRDAYNHGEAIAYTKPQVPFLLGRQDSTFLRLLIRIHAEQEFGKTYRAQDYEKDLARDAQLADQLVGLLKYFEKRYDRNPTTLRKFLKDSEGRARLLSWMVGIANQVKWQKPEDLRNRLVDELLQRMPERRPVWLFGPTRRKSALQSLGLASSGAGEIGQGLLTGIDIHNPLGLASLIVGVGSFMLGAIPTGENILKRLGYVRLDYDGPQWPFSFAYDAPATARTYEEMRANLRAVRRP
jgi:hypothetical protein